MYRYLHKPTCRDVPHVAHVSHSATVLCIIHVYIHCRKGTDQQVHVGPHKEIVILQGCYLYIFGILK